MPDKKVPGEAPDPADPDSDPLDAATSPLSGVVSPTDPSADEPMTDAQAAELRDLCEKKDEPFDGNMTREQADARIAALKDA